MVTAAMVAVTMAVVTMAVVDLAQPHCREAFADMANLCALCRALEYKHYTVNFLAPAGLCGNVVHLHGDLGTNDVVTVEDLQKHKRRRKTLEAFRSLEHALSKANKVRLILVGLCLRGENGAPLQDVFNKLSHGHWRQGHLHSVVVVNKEASRTAYKTQASKFLGFQAGLDTVVTQIELTAKFEVFLFFVTPRRSAHLAAGCGVASG